MENYFGFFNEPIYWRTLVRTAVFSVLATRTVLAISLPFAFYITKVAGFKIQGFLMVPILLPFWGERTDQDLWLVKRVGALLKALFTV